MKLDDSQRAAVAAWFAAGASLSDIQKRIAAEFGVSCTYLDVRLFVADLPQPEEAAPAPAPAAQPLGPKRQDAASPSDEPRTEIDAPEEPLPEMTPVEEGPVDDLPPAAPEDEAQEAPPADVAVDMDAIVIPGCMASGSVTFSDGKTGKWYLDQMGRMGLAEFEPGYRPSPDDAARFQSKLMALFRAKGLIP